ncbi:MAG: hypothetical protein GXP47_02780 [Acidobacteria bacterium]|nr:hypothetical protein [Acidobacteriota bacterium]
MGTTRDLTDLVSVLEEVDSPFERLHQLALAWRSIRKMKAQDRAELARKAGFDGAEEIVERLAGRHGGLAPALLLQAIERARQADSGQLTEIFRQLRDPERRSAVVSEGIRLAGEALVEELGAGGGGADGASATPVAVPHDAAEAGSGEPAGGPPDEAPPGEEGQPEPEVAGTAHGGADAEEAIVLAEPEESPPEKIPARPPAPAPSPGNDAGAEAPRATERAPAPARHDGTPARTAPAGPRRLEPLALRLRGEPNVIHRLQLLRELAAPGSLDAGDVEGLLAEFPWSWARRKALCILIDRGGLDKISSPGELVRSFAPGDRVWCMAALARRAPSASWELDDLLGAVESPALRNRLRRLGQHSSGR